MLSPRFFVAFRSFSTVVACGTGSTPSSSAAAADASATSARDAANAQGSEFDACFASEQDCIKSAFDSARTGTGGAVFE